jgi:competence protein ComEC
VVPYLRSLGLSRIDVMMVTHRDTDHAGGAASVMSTLTVEKVLSSISGAVGEPCVAGQHWVWDGVDFAILHPSAGAYANDTKPNHLSCVLRIKAGGRQMLLTSDIEAPDEVALLGRSAKDLAAEIMLVPHHGSKTSSTRDFIQAVGARDVIFPVGYRNRFGHPKPDVVARYEATESRIWRTDRDGAISITLGHGGAYSLRAWRQEHRRYWHGR